MEKLSFMFDTMEDLVGVESAAKAVAALFWSDLDSDYYSRCLEYAKAVEWQNAVKEARRLLPPRSMQVVVVGDRERLQRQLSEADFAYRVVE